MINGAWSVGDDEAEVMAMVQQWIFISRYDDGAIMDGSEELMWTSN